MEEILSIVLKAIGSLLGAGLVYAISLGLNHLKKNTENKHLETFITSLVEAAEQMYKADDEGGAKRLDYVQTMLAEAGYELSDALRAVIESKVYELNKGGAGK